MTQAIYDKYVSDHAQFEASPGVNGPAWLGRLRTNGLAAFKQAGFPTATRGNEQWKYTNVGPIARAAFDLPTAEAAQAVSLADVKAVAPWDDGWTRLVFVNGLYMASLSTAPGDGVAQVASQPFHRASLRVFTERVHVERPGNAHNVFHGRADPVSSCVLRKHGLRQKNAPHDRSDLEVAAGELLGQRSYHGIRRVIVDEEREQIAGHVFTRLVLFECQIDHGQVVEVGRC